MRHPPENCPASRTQLRTGPPDRLGFRRVHTRRSAVSSNHWESLLGHLDSDHRRALEGRPIIPIDLNDIAATRRARQALAETMPAQPEVTGVTETDHHIPGRPNDPDVRVRVYRPEEPKPGMPALYWIHGGGMVMGDIEGSDHACRQVVKAIGGVVVSVDYRLAPETPFPGPIEDCYAGLVWLMSQAPELGVDPGRVAIGGGSAGGGLAASLAHLIRDRGEHQVAYQWLIYPMLDDRNDTPSSHRITDPRVWCRASNEAGWRALLGERAGTDDVSPHAAAARGTELAGLPPAFVSVGEFDLFLDEDISYAQRLLAAGVATELHVYPGAFPGSDRMGPDAPISRRQVSDRMAALKAALGVMPDPGIR